MINFFPSSDSLHLLDLGVMRKLMFRWVYGEKEFGRKWDQQKKELASQLLTNCQQFMPVEIHRAVRDLKSLRKWKGVEFRSVLLYVGMVIFKQLLDPEEYDSFLILCCATRIVTSKSYKNYFPLAAKMFRAYFHTYISIYGRHSIGSNVHLLTHIVEDMEFHKVETLMDLSTYKFENSLRLLGLQLKSGNRPLAQVSKRILEFSQINNFESKNPFETKEFSPILMSANKNEFSGTFDKIRITPNVVLSSRKIGDSHFLTTNDEIVKMKFAKKENNKYQVFGERLLHKESFFSNPIDSSKLKIFISSGDVTSTLHAYDTQSIVAKMLCIGFEDKFVFMPLVHM